MIDKSSGASPDGSNFLFVFGIGGLRDEVLVLGLDED
jgi:hypothetical protein